VERTLIVCGITEETDADVVITFHLDALGDTGSQREWATDKCITTHETVFGTEYMHRASEPLATTGFPGKQLGHDSFGINAAFNSMDMITVTGNDIILSDSGRFEHPEGTGFFARIEVEKAPDFAFYIGFVTAFFKTPRKQHFAQNPFLIRRFHGTPSGICNLVRYRQAV
jgi:hypothetical protein